MLKYLSFNAHLITRRCIPLPTFTKDVDSPPIFAILKTVVAQKDPKVDWLSIGEAAKYLGVSRDTLRRWEKRGKIKSYRTPGGRRRYTIYDLELAIKAPEPTPPPYQPAIPPTPQPTPQAVLPKVAPKKVESEPTIKEPVKMEPSLPVPPPAPMQPKAARFTLPTWLNPRFFAISFILTVTLIAVLSLTINTLFTLIKGPGEPLNPIPESTQTL